MLLLVTSQYLVIQQDSTGRGVLPIAGICDTSVETVRVNLTPIQGGAEVNTTIDAGGGQFHESLTAKAGMYILTVTTDKNESASIKAGVGEVFVISGHSIASNSGKGYPEDLPLSEHVIVLDWSQPAFDDYAADLDINKMPFKFARIADTKRLPLNSDPQFWGNMATRISQARNCPVLLLSGAYGGSNLEMWAKGIRGEQYGYFDQPGQKPNWQKPIPWGPTRQFFEKIISKTGCRAVLSHHGENDKERTADQVAGYYRTVIDATRSASAPSLSWVICRASVCGRQANGEVAKLTEVRQAQEQIATYAACFPGPDYDATMNTTQPGTGELLDLTAADRYDDLHLTKAGQRKAAGLWADAVLSQISRMTAFVPVPPGGSPDFGHNDLTVPSKPSGWGWIEWAALGTAAAILSVILFIHNRQ